MEQIKYVLLLLFVGFNVVVAVSLLFKVCAEYCRNWWPAPKVGKVLRASAKNGNRAWTNAVRRSQRPAQTMSRAV